MMSRGFMKLFYNQNSVKERIEYADETINQLVRDFIDCHNVNKIKYYENELKDTIKFRSNITDNPIINPCADMIINGGHVERIKFNNGEWYSEYVPTDKNISKKIKKLLRKNIDNLKENTGIEIKKIKEDSTLLKRLMLKTLYILNACYHNDDYEFILNKN